LPHLSPVPGGRAGGPDDLPPPRQRRAPDGGHRAPLGREGQAGVVDTATVRAAAARLARFSRTTPSIAIAPPAIVRSGGTSPSRSHAVSSAKTGTRYRNAVTTVTFALESANATIVYATAEGSTPAESPAPREAPPAVATATARPEANASIGSVPAQVANAATSMGR